MKKKTKTMLIILATLIFLGASTVLIINQYVQKQGVKYIVETDRAPKADAILVLGAQVFANGSVSFMLRDRLLESAELYQNQKAPKILVSGDHGQKNYDEVNTMKEFLKKEKIPSGDVFMDHAGFNTYESIYRARDIFRVKKVIIVTQKYHLMRAVFIARESGLKAYGVGADQHDYGPVMIGYQWRELAARVKDFFAVKLFKPLPKYLGEAIPISGDGSATDEH